jgi:hypothetical protein
MAGATKLGNNWVARQALKIGLERGNTAKTEPLQVKLQVKNSSARNKQTLRPLEKQWKSGHTKV